MRTLITGAGGSIGSELARQVAGPLVLVDRAESALYDAGLEAKATDLRLVDVANRVLVRRLVERTQPDVIFHAAAYKHVPFMETHPSEAVNVNIGGTLSILDAAETTGVPRLVLVSTDKAVYPTSVMGATKRVAEWLVAERARQTGHAYVSVRFGNVAESSGSVIPLFRYQLAHGLPLTITDPECTRYFMSITEAVSLIIEASTIGSALGDIFVLDMGEPRRIIDVARAVCSEAGFDPDAIPVVYIGLRPGERLHERLYHDHEVVAPTSCDRVSVVSGTNAPADLAERVNLLLSYADGEHDESLRELLFDLVGSQEQAVAA